MTKEVATDNATAEGADSREDLLKAKQKLEKETGKKYKVREKIPSIQELILQDALREKSYAETAKFPAIVFVLFVISLHLFLKFVPPSEKKHTLPQMKRRPHLQHKVQEKVSNPMPDPVSVPIKEAETYAAKESGSVHTSAEQAAAKPSGEDEF